MSNVVINMLNIGSGEIVVILLVILLALEPKKLPEFARMLGRMARYFKSSLEEIADTIQKEPPEDLKKEIEKEVVPCKDLLPDMKEKNETNHRGHGEKI